MIHPKYRSDIDGLRAVAILAVVGYHAFPRWVHGGYVGVDIFFVISGYLISIILYSNFDKGTFSYLDFYGRRIKRIFPALLTLFIALAVAGCFLLSGQEYRQLGKYMASGSAFVANFVLWNEAGYFDPAAISKPLQHLWSLAIEEQFYLLWPVVVGVSWKVRSRFIGVISIIGAMSLAASGYLIAHDPVADFYSPIPRIWELMIGGGLAFFMRHPVNNFQRHANLVSVAGMAIIAASIIFFTDSFAFPGYWALLPTIGTAMLIFAGPQTWINRTLLSNPPARWVGLVSYPLYLWHWPLLSLGHSYGIIDGPGKALLMIIAVGLSWVTFRFVETPLRASRAPAIAIGLLCAVAIMGAAGYLTYAGMLPAPSSGQFAELELAQSEKTPDEYPQAPFNGTTIASVRLAGRTDQTVLFSGDSHMGQYFPAVKALYDSGRSRPNYTAEFVSHSHCTPSPKSAITSSDFGYSFSCDVLFAQVMRLAQLPTTKIIVFGGNWAISDVYNDASLRSFGEAIRQLTASGKEVFVVLSSPQGEMFDPAVIMRIERFEARFGGGKEAASDNRDIPVSMLRQKSQASQSRFRATALANGANIIDPYLYLCPHDRCPIFIDGKPTHMDDNHMRPFYVKKYAIPMFQGLLER